MGDLFGDDPPRLNGRKPRKAATSDGSVQRCIDAWFLGYERKWGIKPLTSGGMAGRHFKEMIAAWGEAETARLVDRFFTTTHPQVRRSDYSFQAFARLVHTLVLESARGSDERTIENIDAASRATRRRQ